MNKVYKLRIYPNKTQIKLINETLGCCRRVSNLYIEEEIKYYKETGEFLSCYSFSKIINKLKKTSDTFSWIANYSSKAIKDTIMNTEKTFKEFFKRHNGFPKFKSRKKNLKKNLSSLLKIISIIQIISILLNYLY